MILVCSDALDSPVVVSKGIGAEVDFFQTQRSFFAIFSPTNDTSTTPTMAGSLQIAAPTTPNPTNTLTNAFATAGGAGGSTNATTTTASAGGGMSGQGIPTTGDALLSWLQQGNYSTWQAESAKHDSLGPHFGGVRTFINDTLSQSLSASATSHKKGAAAVKELFGMTGDKVLGWAVWVKVEDDSAMGQGIYWYEFYNDQPFADDTGVAGCSGCHAAGTDYFRSNYPLQ